MFILRKYLNLKATPSVTPSITTLAAFTTRIFKLLTCLETKAVYHNNHNLGKES